MPIYNQGKSDSDGRGMARALAGLRNQVQANRRTGAGDIPDPTPPATEVTPGSLTRLALEETP